MIRRTFLAATTAVLALSAGLAAAQEARTLYWISHGAPADPVWTYFLQGAEQWATDTGHTVNTSFHSGDVPSQQEAVRAAIAAGADGLMIEVHPDPERAMSDGAQSLYPDQFAELMEQISVIATAIGARMVPPVAAGQGAGAAG